MPPRFYEELHGVADGAELDYQDVVVANFIPEMFHCSGFAAQRLGDEGVERSTTGGYSTIWMRLEASGSRHLRRSPSPAGRFLFVNVTYAGFIGSVTGMNAKQISVGEMGGRGLGHWEGVPMAFLVRMALEESSSLDDAIAVFRNNPRTCEHSLRDRRRQDG